MFTKLTVYFVLAHCAFYDAHSAARQWMQGWRRRHVQSCAKLSVHARCRSHSNTALKSNDVNGTHKGKHKSVKKTACLFIVINRNECLMLCKLFRPTHLWIMYGWTIWSNFTVRNRFEAKWWNLFCLITQFLSECKSERIIKIRKIRLCLPKSIIKNKWHLVVTLDVHQLSLLTITCYLFRVAPLHRLNSVMY